MRIALVSPYSWSYPGGVTRHIEALAEQFMASGHHVRVLSPYDPPDRLSARMHRGARPEARELQDWVIPLGRYDRPSSPTGPCRTCRTRRTRSRRCAASCARAASTSSTCTSRWLRSWATTRSTRSSRRSSARSTAIPRTSSPTRSANAFGAKRKLQRLHVRIAVSEAAAWTGRRFYGGDYRIIPNGGRRAGRAARASRRRRRARRCASPSSVRPSSARGSRSCCAPSRRCATTSTSSS